MALRVLVRGVGDIGSAVAHRLFVAGHMVVVHDGEQPTTTRRGMAFADAIFDGRVTLERVEAIRVDDPDAVAALLAHRTVVPVVVGDFKAIVGLMAPHVLVDARMRKRDVPEIQRGLAPFTIGLGTNFVGGLTTDVVVETSWEQLGSIVTRGASLPLRGEPREIAGHARDRYVYAPVAGTLVTSYAIGQAVTAGDLVARIDGTSLRAPLSGVLAVSLLQLAPHAVPDLFAFATLVATVAALVIWRIGTLTLMLAGSVLGLARSRLAPLARLTT